MLKSTLHETFDAVFHGSKWEVLKGYHVFRHSIASNLAREGVDQREIDGLMGHQTEAMRKRYRHLFPEQRVNAIKKLFG
jgi:site-specific recombinase XerD